MRISDWSSDVCSSDLHRRQFLTQIQNLHGECLAMGRFGVGQGLRRVEDLRFLTGEGQYSDDIRLEGQCHGVLLRSPFAHARIAAIYLDEARAAPGVLGVYKAARSEEHTSKLQSLMRHT